MKIILTANTSWYLYNFRFQLIENLLDLGHEVYILTPNDNYTDKIKKLNITHIPIKMVSHGKSILYNFFLIIQYIYIFLKIRPTIVHNFTIKPVLFGSIASKFFSIKVINSVPGLGLMFNTTYKNPVWLKKFVLYLYKFSFSKKNKIIFQNPDDMNFFILNKIADFNQSYLIKGSGVDTEFFTNVNIRSNEIIKFGIMSRMIWSKGVHDFVKASKKVHEINDKTSFHILGSPPDENPDKIPISWLRELNKKYAFIHWKPHSDIVFRFLESIDIFVLPTYYPEGVPKSLLEAAAMGLPIIASNTSGCKEVVENNKNGFLVDIKDEVDLYNKMLLLSKKSDLRNKMGITSRKIAKREFDIKLINEQTLRIYFE